jgi:hypothetical protein
LCAYKFNPDLIDDIARDRAVLFLGAGVSASAVTANGVPISGWGRFLESLCGLTQDPIRTQAQELIAQKDFLLACEILQSALPDRWEQLITEEFGRKAEPSKLHRSIIGLQQRIILTTNFDKVLETAFDSKDTASGYYRTVIAKVDEDVFKVLKNHSQTYIIKIHGTIDNVKSLVFSRSEYIRLAFGNNNYEWFLENLLLNYTFLFIGVSMEDPAILSTMELYALRYKGARPHYIFASDKSQENIENIYKTLRKLYLIKYDTSNNHSELPGIIDSLAEEARRRRREIFAGSGF